MVFIPTRAVEAYTIVGRQMAFVGVLYVGFSSIFSFSTDKGIADIYSMVNRGLFAMFCCVLHRSFTIKTTNKYECL